MSVQFEKTIKPIDKGIVHRICAGQVITDLSSAVKELVENSLDAAATTIEINLKDYGQQSLQVIDNGNGISPLNFKVLALKHHTSKLEGFHDLQSLTTYGFRGEALSSIAAMANLSVETRTVNESIGSNLSFDHSGVLISESKIARKVGTTVTVKNLFSNLPVRSKEFSRNVRREYGKLVSLLNAYALIANGVRFVCTNTTGKNARSVVLKTQGNGSLKDNIITVLGINTFSCLESVSISLSDSCKVDGFLSKSGQGNGRSLGDRQYFFVNGRPVDMPKVSKLLNEIYKGANSKQYPIAILSFTVPTRAYDVNVTPDKRKIFISEESSILQALREGLQKVYSPSDVFYSVNKVEQPAAEEDSVELFSSQRKSCTIIKTSCPISSLRREEDNTESSNSIISQDEHMEEHNSDCDNGSVSQDEDNNGRNTGHVTHSDNASEFAVDDQHLHLKEGLIPENEGSLMSPEFTLRAHTALKDDKRTIRSRQTRSIILDQAAHVSRTVENGATSNNYSYNHSRHVQSTLNKFVTVNKRSYDNTITALSEVPVLRSQGSHCQMRSTNTERRNLIPSSPYFEQIDGSAKANQGPHCQLKTANTERHNLITRSPYFEQIDGTAEASEVKSLQQLNPDNTIIHNCKNSISSGCDYTDKEPNMELDEVNSISLADTASVPPSRNDLISTTEHVLESDTPLHSSPAQLKSPRSFDWIISEVQFSFQYLTKRRDKRLSSLPSSKHRCGKADVKSCYTAATLKLSQLETEEQKEKALALATTELEKLFKKEYFRSMKVIGQFNLGFIIGKLDQDLFIVDQHAADEKYNFERLSQSTILNQQPLFRPMRLELSLEEEIVASMHMDIIRKNGFTLEEDPDALPGCRYKLTSVPFSKNITFGVEDVKELISTLSDEHGECSIIGSYKLDTSGSICPSRVRAMLASRACQSSTMVGDPLDRNEMQKILEHLAKLKSPWNCPHGRPTMRHLIDLTTIHKNSELTM
ncbi:PREDICTED: DNA mismatch repair protein PMS1 [Lupinus angustifolius]|uniref:DNA mismatch repair protein PMS1 n=1 Tax=Lupinus angustifolius TaxID=3871 RepID=UPI00092E7837|nr:PREDICTED: DNA mismatch repair protein PMS1 [Lupinus angustifolius]